MKKLFVCLAFAAIALMAVLFTGCGDPKVSLNQYITIEAEGNDGYGKLRYSFNKEKFLEDFSSQIKATDKVDTLEKAVRAYSNTTDAEWLYESCIRYSVDKTSGLSNGDIVTLTWNCNDEKAKENFKTTLDYSPISFAVHGLTPVETFDPFEHLTVTYTGISPSLSIQLEEDSADVCSDLYFSAENSNGLANGDQVKVKVSLGYTNEESFIEKYQKIPSVWEKTYTIEGQNEYISTAADVSDGLLAKMKSQTEDIIRANAASWSSGTLKEVVYLGNYFLLPKTSSYYGNNNQFILVYRIKAEAHYESFTQDVTYYYAVRFTDLMTLEDGTQNVDLSDYDKLYEYSGVTVTTNIKSWGSYVKINFDGYEKLDVLFNDAVVKKVETYTYENNVKDE